MVTHVCRKYPDGAAVTQNKAQTRLERLVCIAPKQIVERAEVNRRACDGLFIFIQDLAVEINAALKLSQISALLAGESPCAQTKDIRPGRTLPDEMVLLVPSSSLGTRNQQEN